MHLSEMNDARGPEVPEARQPAAHGFATSSDPDDGTARAQVLARMPDLDDAEPSTDDAEPSADDAEPSADDGRRRGRWDGRMISQRLSIRLLVGGGLALLLAAVAPFVLKNKGNTNRHDGLPEWHQGVPAPNSEEAPTWKPATVQTPPQTPAGESRPQISDLQRGPPPSPQVDPPQSPTPPGRPKLVRRPEAYANQPRTIEDRAGPPTKRPREYQPRSYRPVEPGVARFEGIIKRPSVIRTTNDPARSSIR